MPKKPWPHLLLSVFLPLILGIYPAASSRAEDEPKPIQIRILEPDEWPVVTTSGRLALEKNGEETLVLHSKNAKTYIIKGGLAEKLKSLLLDLGESNLVTVTGKRDGSSRVSCHNSYKFDAKGDKIMESLCIRYYNLVVTEIIETTKSDEEMPPPERDIAEEEKAMKSTLSQLQKEGLAQILEIRGKIMSLNLRSSIKTVEVSYRDKHNQPLSAVLFLTNNTRVAKKNIADDKEPMYLTENSLREGQEITAIYSRDQRKAEALFITITKE